MSRPTIIVDNCDGTKVEVTMREFVTRWINQVGNLDELAITKDDCRKVMDIKNSVKLMAIAKFYELQKEKV
jgi:hypothetical protein